MSNSVVETQEPPEVDRALEYPASFEVASKRMLAYGQCCCETAEVLSGLLVSATLTQALREKFARLRDGQKVIGRELVSAVTAATEQMRKREEAMLELPVTPSHNRPPASARFAICEGPACGHPLTEKEARESLASAGNRLCPDCWKRAVTTTQMLPLQADETLETPQAFR